MTWLAPLFLAGIEIVADGQPRVRVETDGSPAAEFAAGLLKRHVVLITGTALPSRGPAAALRFQAGAGAGYAIRRAAGGAVVAGRDLARAAFDMLEAWGCRFGGAEPVVPHHASLSLEPRAWRPQRELWIEAAAFDPSLPAQGWAIRGIGSYRPGRFEQARALGYLVRVASTTFDDFLPPMHFKAHPEWFALRNGKREPRGNFALTNAGARAAYLEALGAWLEARPEVHTVGLWPEVTTVWCEESLAVGAAEAYALLWREAAARFPGRRFEILATGLTLRPPRGRVPSNVEVRLRPGRDASALQGIAGQEMEAVVRGWELRGARMILEMDAAPDSWCGMPWPCHEAIRANARRFEAAVLLGGGHAHASIWRDPSARVPLDQELASKARSVRSWGHPRDAADLFPVAGYGIASRIAAVERLRRTALRTRERTAAADAWFGYSDIERALPKEAAAQYRRYLARDYHRLLDQVLPGGATRKLGPAQVRETFDRIEIETDLLRLAINRRTGSVESLSRRVGDEWKGGEGRFFAAVSPEHKVARVDGRIHITSPGTGRLRIDLRGRLSAGGPGWKSTLELSGASGRIRQVAEIDASGRVASGCKWAAGAFDRWICPPHAREGRLTGSSKGARFYLPRGTLIYCRSGEEGPGLAARLNKGGTVSLVDGETPMLLAIAFAGRIEVDWIVFTSTGELAH